MEEMRFTDKVIYTEVQNKRVHITTSESYSSPPMVSTTSPRMGRTRWIQLQAPHLYNTEALQVVWEVGMGTLKLPSNLNGHQAMSSDSVHNSSQSLASHSRGQKRRKSTCMQLGNARSSKVPITMFGTACKFLAGLSGPCSILDNVLLTD